MINYLRMKKDCFWEYSFSDKEIKRLAASQDKRERVFLFEKILLNSTSVFHDLKIFEKDSLHELIESYQVPQFNDAYAFKRKNMAEVYFLGKPLLVNELKWVS